MKILSKIEVIQKIHKILPEDIKKLSMIFQSNNFDIFLVGGCVRDTFLNKEAKDFDVCTNATPDQIKRILRLNKIEFNEQGAHFGVIVAKLSEDVEIATFRSDKSNDTGNNQDTEVTFGVTLEEDLQRRDLTINAIALNLSTNEIVDTFNGIDDLKNEIVRTVGNADDRFKEDSLRKLRSIRFSTRLGFKLHQDIVDSIKKDHSLNISKERIVGELENTFSRCQSVNHVINLLHDLNLLPVIFDNLETTKNILEINSFNSFLLSFIDVRNTNIKDKLLELKFSVKTAHTVDTIIQLKRHFKADTIDALSMAKKLKQCDIPLKDVISFIDPVFTDQLIFLWQFEMDKKVTQDFIDAGLKGKDIGDAISKWTQAQFIQAGV